MESHCTIPGRFMRYNTLPGADNTNMTLEDLQASKADSEKFVKGLLYGKKFSKELYAPNHLLDRSTIFHFNQESTTNDCMVHAVNYALRYPWFVSREQVIRLMAARLKVSKENAAKKKIDGGVAANSFRDFCVINNEALSLELVKEFDTRFN